MNYKSKISFVAIILFLIFGGFFFSYQHYAYNKAQSHLNKYANIIAEAFWNFNSENVLLQLTHASKFQNYKKVILSDLRGKELHEFIEKNDTGMERFFISLKMMKKINLISDIIYQGEKIGYMKVVWKCDAIYFELSILFLLIMIYIASCFVFRILSSKELCENKLKEHKQALSQTTSLLASESKKNKRIQQFLNKSREQYQLIADNTTDVIWLTDMNNICTYISPSSFNMTGFTPKEIIGKPIDALMLPDYQRKLKEIYNEKLILIKEGDAKGWESEKFELQEYCKNEKIIWAELDAGFYPNKNNNPAGFIGVTRNITTQILLEKEIIKAQQIAIKQGSGTLVGKIAENIAHDFNSIFGIIMKNTAVPLLKHKDSEIQDSLGVILNQTRQGQALARALISFAKNKKSKKEFLQINKKINFVMTLFKPDLKDIEVIKEYMPGTPDMLADSGMIEHALANLIQNSIQALSFKENPKIVTRTYYSDNKITIEIEDNGCGIPKEYFEKIYEPSFTLKGNQDITDSYKPDIQGTGYGMTNVKQYVDQHRGKLSIESKFGSGTKIILSLPML